MKTGLIYLVSFEQWRSTFK